jgi:redox-sensitive bicupin YhaK (pirin superfamily)
MDKPQYQEFDPEQVPRVENDGNTVYVIAGQHDGTEGAVKGISTAPLYLDVQLEGNADFTQALPEQHTAFIYVYDGSCKVAEQHIEQREFAVLTAGEIVQVRTGVSGCAFLLIAASPLQEPVARYGPFVMNTQTEIKQAIRDMQNGTLVQTES